jgi:hypothetical protein
LTVDAVKATLLPLLVLLLLGSTPSRLRAGSVTLLLLPLPTLLSAVLLDTAVLPPAALVLLMFATTLMAAVRAASFTAAE